MSTKSKDILLVAQSLRGRRVKIFKSTVGELLTGEIVSCAGSGIQLKDVEWCTGVKYENYYLSTHGIQKITPA